MIKRKVLPGILLVTAFTFAIPLFALAAQDRAEVEARVWADVMQDLAETPYFGEWISGRVCLDGRSAENFPGEVAEYWVNLECHWCGIREPLMAQRQNPDLCIVARHVPTPEFSESLKKALSYEALSRFSSNAANLFWDKVIPKTSDSLPLPYEASLILTFQEANIDVEAFGEALGNEAADIINQDIMDAQGRFFMVPTWVLAGIRFPSCDFTAAQVPVALELANKARAGDKDAKERVISVITNALMEEPLL
jgi:hypothetical protein